MTSKRKREADGAMFSGARFSFGFQASGDDDAGADAPPAVAAHPTSASIRVACNVNGADLAPGDLVVIDWAQSSWTQLHVTSSTDASIAGTVHPQYVALPTSAYSAPDAPVFSLDAPLWQFDYVFDPTFAGCTWPLHFSSAPLTVEPNLQSLSWPLPASTFIEHVYNQRCMVVHGSSHRLQSLLEDLHQLDVDTLILTASRTVAWLAQAPAKTRMQYLEVQSPEMARAIYKAGHSLYFNPAPDVQEKYLSALCADLGMDFTSALDGGMGGDIELFAVQGRHSTPWHLDAQQNITIQLTGTKRWSFVKGPVHDPMTNLHLASTNTPSVQDDLLTHCMSGATPAMLTPPADDDPAVASVVLRPGSVLYVPAGYWHKVEAMDEGSLSMNFSIDGSRWLDVLWNRLLPTLMAQPSFRARPDLRRGPEDARAQLKQLLASLRATITEMEDNVDTLLPDALFAPPVNAVVSVAKLASSTDLERPIQPSSVLVRSSVGALIATPHVPASEGQYTLATGGVGRFSDGFKAERVTVVAVPPPLTAVMNRLLEMPFGATLAVATMQDMLFEHAALLTKSLHHCIELLVQHGLFTLASS
ncbi:hypothetical protein SPRG_15682 [Saprolegnia parasitica CBS 223.65]|uniref:JmjC domain-containing protein n=1 Tax=Saprolegnia parasitica (strain CBS 223.65) TaxID=695850 RepID=A0A067BL28_SAPPC|nr:hypothetical protein SPRG_15682 [Saprolegnia parasitica CBS 223.65]KDO19159.1 hypothetical protein SPRG_15682 [Saprolegnia parasitica CBS 223.65]|eukprot:XP_012210129.1 hypothetical protein SPRG_15682 [Saprolegnia parasitica CBS 223.65]